MPQAVARQAAALLACLLVSVHCPDAALPSMQSHVASAQMLAGACQPTTALRMHLPDCQASCTKSSTPSCLPHVPLQMAAASGDMRRVLEAVSTAADICAQQAAVEEAERVARSLEDGSAAGQLCCLSMERSADRVLRQRQWHQLCSSPAGDTGQDSLPILSTCSQLC